MWLNLEAQVVSAAQRGRGEVGGRGEGDGKTMTGKWEGCSGGGRVMGGKWEGDGSATRTIPLLHYSYGEVRQ